MLDFWRLELVNWVMFYESIYEIPHEEQPSEDMINDDDALDQWVSDYKTKRRHEQSDHKRLVPSAASHAVTGESQPRRASRSRG